MAGGAWGHHDHVNGSRDSVLMSKKSFDAFDFTWHLRETDVGADHREGE
jgi:uncharacterized protein YijF (DUF1287 family)